MHYEVRWKGDPNLSARPHTKLRAPLGSRFVRTREQAEESIERWLRRLPVDVARAVRAQHAPRVVCLHLGVEVDDDAEPCTETASAGKE